MTPPATPPTPKPQLNPFFHDYHFIQSYENISIYPNKQMALPPYGNKF
jgi:hypothetical protein